MNIEKTTRPIKALGLCSGGLDSILSALVLQNQGIDVTWISFETPFFSSQAAKNASARTGIPIITQDITNAFMEMMKAPKAGFGKNMNPCMDCHTLMFSIAGNIMKEKGFHFLFSGEVLGQRPKSQTKNALKYVEKNSGFGKYILRPLSAKCLPETIMEQQGLVDREKLMDITGRSRKVQMKMAKDFGITEYPAPAGGCLLTDKGFSDRLRDLLIVQKTYETRHLHLLKHGRHFRLDSLEDQNDLDKLNNLSNKQNCCKLIVGRSKYDNQQIMTWFDKDQDIRLRHAEMPGPDAILMGNFSDSHIETAAGITAGYTKSKPGETAKIKITKKGKESIVLVPCLEPSALKDLMI
ncbi:MAG: tRNA 4-thiouridine(8) synthase ThiI [Desulfobacteraceae bacterium 4572_89]|nr:MAG: tRNA 4-thiouridine(8) synthase ThiI [Desulfobacteraceae bacterium 4572_89]